MATLELATERLCLLEGRASADRVGEHDSTSPLAYGHAATRRIAR